MTTESMVRRNMTESRAQRQRLPNRRCHEVIQFEHGGFTYIAGIGRFDDGRLAEVFLTAAKTGTARNMNTVGTLVEWAVQ